MPSKPTANRREFLQGQSAAQALADLVDGGAAPALGLPPSFDASYLVQFGRRAMACQFEVSLNAGQYASGAEAALAALDLIDELAAQLTVYRDTSEIAEINRTAGQRPVVVELRLFQLLQRAVALHGETLAAYDITSGPLSKVWGFYRRQGVVPIGADLTAALACVGSQHVRLDPQEQTIRFDRAGMELNLGSIGKGYALDRAAELLAAAGIEHFLLHGGQSSVLARGGRGPQGRQDGWLVAIGDPLRPGKTLAQVRLRERALGTSGSGVQHFRHEGRRYGHILDPRTGWPAEGVLSASVVAPTAAEADAVATACYVLGEELALDYCRTRPEIGLVLVTPAADRRGSRVVTANLEATDLTILTSSAANNLVRKAKN